jgi:hypothetical protein
LEAGILKMIERKANLADAIFGESEARASTVGGNASLSKLLAEAFGLRSSAARHAAVGSI